MNKIEILAPVGGEDQLVAAVRSGANAVYLGTKSFNARRSAQNFGEQELKNAVCYCHARGVAVHVALNTLINDDELQSVLDELAAITRCGADAVIVQDMAVAKLVREHCPNLAMHASTQMTVHNVSGAAALENLGFSRVVLARELSLAEIKAIAAATSLEIEVFVHGALCMCVSGDCYLSSMLGERSGNRGRCAQPCRLNFKAGTREYALSLKDMSYISHLGELVEAGVCSLKIEGRMKRPEYVAAAVNACRRVLDGLDYDAEALKQVFSRGGFTDGYLTSKRGLDMFGYRTKDDVEGFGKISGSLGELVRNEFQSIPIDLSFTMRANEPASLYVTDGNNKIKVLGDIPEIAKTKPTDVESARRALEKTGGTPFFVRSFNSEISENIILPASKLNELRRNALEQLMAVRSMNEPKLFADNPLTNPMPYTPRQNPQFRVRAEKLSQISAVLNAEYYILPIVEILDNPSCLSRFGSRLVAELPALFFPCEEQRISTLLKRAKDAGIENVMCENLGAVKAAEGLGFKLFGGHGLNILNSEALCEYERLGVSDITTSFELSLDRIRRLGGTTPRGFIAYAHLPLMRFRVCPIQGSDGCGSCDGQRFVTDRKGNEFTVLCSERKYQSLLNPVPLYMSDKNLSGVDFLTLYFTIETAGECRSVCDSYAARIEPPKNHTNGLYFREIE
ncbi:MAG: DUF3656 domain-containing protein [Oscillospiraceae bacterium]